MIEINLLEKKKPFRFPIILGIDLNEVKIKPLVIAYIIQILIDSNGSMIIGEQDQAILDQINQKNQELRSHKEFLQKNANLADLVLGFEKQIDRLKEREKQVKTVIDLKTNPKNIISSISKIIPEDMWVDNLTIEGTGEIKILGGSISYRSVGEFITRANELEFFGGSILIRNSVTEEEMINGTSLRVQKYTLEGKIVSYGVIE